LPLLTLVGIEPAIPIFAAIDGEAFSRSIANLAQLENSNELFRFRLFTACLEMLTIKSLIY